MKILLDTHIFLWFSAASLWEIAIKHGLGKLNLIDDFDVLFPKQLEINGFEMLPVKIAHLSNLITLPLHHRDPFDRLLAAQTIAENMQIVSVDDVFDTYQITRHK